MKLKQVASITAGYPFRGKIHETAGSPVAAVQMKDVSLSSGIDWAGCVRTTLTGKREPGWLQPGDILVAARGSHNYAVAVDHHLLDARVQAVAAPHFFVVSLTRKNLLADYLAWLLNQSPCQRHFELNAEGTLTKSIRRNVLEETPIAVPPLAKQRAIIGLADTLRREQHIVQQLVRNGEQQLNSIARQLLPETTTRHSGQSIKHDIENPEN